MPITRPPEKSAPESRDPSDASPEHHEPVPASAYNATLPVLPRAVYSKSTQTITVSMPDHSETAVSVVYSFQAGEAKPMRPWAIVAASGSDGDVVIQW